MLHFDAAKLRFVGQIRLHYPIKEQKKCCTGIIVQQFCMFLILFCYDDMVSLWVNRYAFGGVFMLDSGCERSGILRVWHFIFADVVFF